MRRKLFTLCSAVSLLLCVAMCVLWVRSNWVSETVEWTSPQLREAEWSSRFLRVYIARGRLRVELSRMSTISPQLVRWYANSPTEASLKRERKSISRGRAGSELFAFEWKTGPLPMSPEYRWDGFIIGTPLWPLTIAAGVLPLWWLAGWQRIRRRDGVLCPTCGYDLRATPDRCPECGKSPEAKNAA